MPKNAQRMPLFCPNFSSETGIYFHLITHYLHPFENGVDCCPGKEEGGKETKKLPGLHQGSLDVHAVAHLKSSPK